MLILYRPFFNRIIYEIAICADIYIYSISQIQNLSKRWYLNVCSLWNIYFYIIYWFNCNKYNITAEPKMNILIVVSSAPPHLVFGILRFRINSWHFIKTFRLILLHDFDVGLLMRVNYPKQSPSPLSNFHSDLLNGAY